MKRSSWIGVLTAGGLLVAGCSSSSGTAAPATTATSAPSRASSSSGFSSSATSSDDTSATKAAAAELDEATTTWFTTFCTSFGEIAKYAQPDLAGKSIDEVQQTAVAAYTGLATATSKVATDLQATPPPTIPNGDQIASETSAGLLRLTDVYGRGAQTISALTPRTEADLKTALQAVETEASAAAPTSLTDLDPGVEAAVEQLPECSNLGS